ncbi:MAG: 2-oxoglutarate dehydrogenase complex dihydrolipoyllysine-residue succinyltransferase [Steroidobacteraceae bacterium]
MSTEIRVPQLPESVADATLVAWRKEVGESVARDENIADLETDKVVLEVPVPVNGTVRELKVEAGATVTSGQLLAVIEEGAAAPSVAAAKPAATPQATPAAKGAASAAKSDKSKLSPSVRRMVEENKLDPKAIEGSGRDGRITKGDVVAHLDRSSAMPSGAIRAQQRVPMTRLRQRVAQRLVEAQATQALLTTFNEVDLSAVQALRAKYKDSFEKDHGVKLGYMSFFVKACVAALKKFPIVNAMVDGGDIVYHEYYDIGVAVSTDRGLMVPVIRDADGKSFAAIEKEIGEFASKARAGTITIEELTGGTFSITNGGIFGSMLSTPIVNAPQSAILGMHRIQERPIVVDGAVVARPMMYLAVTYDHRIIDGRDSVQFLVAIRDALEDPGRMLLGI